MHKYSSYSLSILEEQYHNHHSSMLANDMQYSDASKTHENATLKLFLHLVRILQGTSMLEDVNLSICVRNLPVMWSDQYLTLNTHKCDFIKCPELREIDPNYCSSSISPMSLKTVSSVTGNTMLPSKTFLTSCPSCSSWPGRRQPWSLPSRCSPTPGSRPTRPSRCKGQVHYSHFMGFWSPGITHSYLTLESSSKSPCHHIHHNRFDDIDPNLQNQTMTPRRSCLTDFSASFLIVVELEAPLQPSRIRSVGTSTWLGDKGDENDNDDDDTNLDGEALPHGGASCVVLHILQCLQ